jgi:hypothetical protein
MKLFNQITGKQYPVVDFSRWGDFIIYRVNTGEWIVPVWFVYWSDISVCSSWEVII